MIEALLPSFSEELLKIAAGAVSPYEIHLSEEERALNRYFDKGNYVLGKKGRENEKKRRQAEADDLYERTGYREKVAAPSKTKLKVLDFHKAEVKDWPGFEKDLKNKAFQNAMLKHPETGTKLQKYVKNFGGLLKSKEIIAIAPSRTEEAKEYKVKVLPTGRLACECKDWQYHHSVRKTDCDHIRAVRTMYRAGLIKTDLKAKKHP